MVSFPEPISIEKLVKIGLEQPQSGWKEGKSSKTKEELAEFVEKFLIYKSTMLLDYFSIEIDQQTGNLLAMPLIVKNFEPNWSHLPLFILHLASDVNWQSEISCFESIAKQIANFYSQPLAEFNDTTRHQLEHCLFFTLKQQTLSSFYPSKTNQTAIVEVTDLHRLYKVFERC